MHRAEFDITALRAATEMPSVDALFYQYLEQGQGHAAILHPWPIGLSLLLASPTLNRSRWRGLVLGLLFAILGILLLASAYPVLASALEGRIPVLTQFPFSRGYFLLPLLLFLLFGACLHTVLSRKHGTVVAAALLALQGGSIVLSNPEIVGNFAILARGYGRQPTYGEFFATDVFDQIRLRLGAPVSYRVAAVGFHPSILQYNGFYTLDSYQSLYPLTYKRDFRKIIAGELDRSADLRVYFDSWGSRCYVFSAELGKNYFWDKSSDKAISNLSIDVGQFQAMGGRFLLSSVPITRIAGQPARLVGVFETPTSFWRIHVYEPTADVIRATVPKAANQQGVLRTSAWQLASARPRLR